MNLKKTSWHARLFKAVYEKPLPNNLCDYFWPVIMTAILGIFLWPIYILLNKADEKMSKYVHLYVAFFIYIGLSAYILFIFSSGKGNGFHFAYYAIYISHYIGLTGVWTIIGLYLIPYLCVVGVVLVFALIIVFIQGIIELYKLLPHHRTHEYKEKQPNILIEWLKAKKHKYCPPITWK